MNRLKKKIFAAILILLLGAGSAGILLVSLPYLPYGFSREIPEAEQHLRLQVVAAAEQRLGTLEGSEAHRQIIDLYNSHEPLAQNYTVTYEDNWCAAFASAMFIENGLTDIFPTECGCQRQIGLFLELGRWEESDNYLPLPGDVIYYAWDEFTLGDCTGWADHVGIVAGTWGPFIQVIEGNKDDSVAYRYILRGDFSIRGYGLPEYGSK